MIDILNTIPKATEIESAVLGLGLGSEEACALMLSHLTWEDFAPGRNRLVFEAMRELFTADAPVNPASLRSHFQNHGQLDEVGGLSFTDDLSDAASGVKAEGMDLACEYLRRYTKARKFIALCEDYREKAMEQGAQSDDLFAQAGTDFFRLLSDRDDEAESELAEVLPDEVDALTRPVEGGIMTGLDLDNITKGFKPGNLVLVAGKTSHGKSALAHNFLLTAGSKMHSAIVSMEMTRSEIIERFLSIESGVAYESIEEHNLDSEQLVAVRKAIDPLSEKDITIIAKGSVDVDRLYATARRLKLQHNTGLLIVDYMQQVESTGERREREVANVSRMLKRIAMDLDMVVIGLSQFSREASNQLRPQLHQLKESGALEQDANTVIILWNPAADGKHKFPDEESEGQWAGKSTKNVIELNVAKNRGGKTGFVKVGFDGSRQRFYNLSPQKETAMDWLQ